MSGWQLGLAFAGCLLAGVVLGITLVAWYARRVYRRQVGQLLGGAQQLTATAASGRPVTPPPPR